MFVYKTNEKKLFPITCGSAPLLKALLKMSPNGQRVPCEALALCKGCHPFQAKHLAWVVTNGTFSTEPLSTATYINYFQIKQDMSFDTIIHYVAYPNEIAGLDLVLPLLVIFSLLFFSLRATDIMKKPQAIGTSLVLAFMVILPHITGTYPPCYDLVIMMNNVMAQFGIAVLLAFTFVLVLAFIGVKPNSSKFFMGMVAAVTFGFLVYSFFASKGGYYQQVCPGPPPLFFSLIQQLLEA